MKEKDGEVYLEATDEVLRNFPSDVFINRIHKDLKLVKREKEKSNGGRKRSKNRQYGWA
jgi:hypothetical protein